VSGAGEQDHNRVPLPGSLSIWINPPFAVTMVRTVVSPKPVPFPAFLVVKKDRRDAGGFSIHAASVVPDGEKNTGKGSNSLWRHRTGNALELTVAGLYDNAATLGQSVAGIEHKVEKDLLGLRLIDFDQTEIGSRARSRTMFRRSGG